MNKMEYEELVKAIIWVNEEPGVYELVLGIGEKPINDLLEMYRNREEDYKYLANDIMSRC